MFGICSVSLLSISLLQFLYCCLQGLDLFSQPLILAAGPRAGQTPLPICLFYCLAHLVPCTATFSFDMAEFSPCTCLFKSPGTWQTCLQG